MNNSWKIAKMKWRRESADERERERENRNRGLEVVERAELWME